MTLLFKPLKEKLKENNYCSQFKNFELMQFAYSVTMENSSHFKSSSMSKYREI